MRTPFLSDYRRMELSVIGPRRFAGKVLDYLVRRRRLWQARRAPPRHWADGKFLDDLAPSGLAGGWLHGSGAAMSEPAFAALEKGVMSRAERARERAFYANGREVRLDDPPCDGRWDVDPVGGGRWLATSPFEPMGASPGDIRFPWELGRLHHLAAFGQAWRYTHDIEWPGAVVAHVEEVLGENPYERGIHWRDGLQLAVRIFSLVAAADLCHDVPGELHRCLNNAVAAHALALRRQMSPQGSITNNHAIGEAAGLVLAGLFLSRWPGASGFVRRGLGRLESELKRQIYADGTPYEGSLPYVRFDLEFLLLLMLALRRTGSGVPAWLSRNATAIAGALAVMVDRQGRVPPLGDGDDGRVLRLDEEPYLTVNETLHLAERTLDKAGLAPAPSSAGFALWAAGPAIPARGFKSAANDLAVHLPDAGVIHIRDAALDVWIDCGPTGLGPKGPGGHGHNDTTAIVVHLDGVALLHDPGWFTYYGDPAMRDRLRATAAHNTIIIDGAEQARLGTLFEIRNECTPTLVRLRTPKTGTVGIVCGHSGYDRLRKGVTFRRFVVVGGGQTKIVRVTDVVTARDPVAVRSHLGSDLAWHAEGANRLTLCGRHVLELRGGQTNVTVGQVPCSVETGVLETGSAVEWTVPGGKCKRASGAARWRYVSRWQLSVGPRVPRDTPGEIA